MKSNPSRTILCSWTPGYWSTVEMYEYAYGNQRWGELSLSYTGNLTGQCYMVQNKTKFTCEMARGNQMTSGRIMRCQPDDTLWARCRWQNDMVSTCYWRETIQDCILLDLGDPEFRTNNLILPDPRMSGVCYASNGYWINCRGFDNCYVGNTLRLHVRNVQVTCNWQNGESKTCALNEDSYLDCSDTAPTDSWGLCEANNGSWAWCQARRDCFLNRTLETGGHMTRIFCMQSKHQWSTCLASEQAWFRCEGASLNGISQCATDRGQWTRCLWNDGFNVECDLFTGRNSVSQAAICNSDGGEDEYNYCRWHRNETYLTECVKPWVGRLSHCYLHPGHWATCYHESSNEVGCVSGNCFNDFECHDGIECESVEYAGWNLCLNFNGSYGWCPVGKSADQCIFWGRRIPVPKPTATSIMCKIDRNTWATCDRAEGKCCDCVFSSKTDIIPTQTTLRSLQCHSEDGDVGVCSWDRDYPQQCNWRSQYNPSVLHCEFADSDIFVRCMKYSADFQTWTDCVYTDQYSDVVDNRLADGTLGRCYATNGTYGFCSISGARVLCREWASIPPLKQVQCAWGNNRYTNCTETDGRWLCSGSVTSPSEMGFCSTSDWKWGFCNGQLQCSWDQTGAKVVELLADVKMEMRVHPAILFTTPARPGKVWCVLRDSSLAGPDFSMQWYFPNGTRIPTGFSKHFVISSFLCRESGQMMSSLHILATQAKYTGTYECRTSIQNRVLVARTLVMVRGCNEDQFECPSDNSCIPHDWMCDGTADCEDLSDEVNC
ncbi:hypothetical protein CAPTEDRAFT_171854 [Capitella teleta]|uniref:Ig-like domain-containing protein n=1 Tax=Capitella teleta TaxID=283909 RepID=R7U9U5_CAPTE|nr:hypothetical protein CAPTEDRAFT_171854 [Capitella teleta]|eukprot:ELU00583.1 hypothetical protein CAPTEDRAFT_171854 [Capitella teleta]